MYLVTASLRPTPDAVVLLLPRPRTSRGGTVFVVIGRVGGLLEPLNKHSWFMEKMKQRKTCRKTQTTRLLYHFELFGMACDP